MFTYSFTKNANLCRLQAELLGLGLTNILNIYANGTIIDINFSSELSSDQQAILTTAVTNHVKVTSQETINKIIISAADYGSKIIKDFGTRNVLAGKTEDQIDVIFDGNSDLIRIAIALLSGSLKYARRKVQAMNPDGVGITEADKTWLIDQLNLYLGNP